MDTMKEFWKAMVLAEYNSSKAVDEAEGVRQDKESDEELDGLIQLNIDVLEVSHPGTDICMRV